MLLIAVALTGFRKSKDLGNYPVSKPSSQCVAKKTNMRNTWRGLKLESIKEIQKRIAGEQISLSPDDPPKKTGRPRSPIPASVRQAAYNAKRSARRRAQANVAIPPVTPSATLMPWGVRLVLPSPPFRIAVKLLPLVQTFRGLVAVRITAYPPDRRRRDLDNLLKSLLDALQHTGIIADDSNVIDLHIVRGAYRQGGSCEIEVRAANGVSKAAQDAEIPAI